MNKKLLLAALLLLSQHLVADLTPYFKPALNKGNNHSIKGVDFIYTLNLDQRPEKFATCVSLLQPYGITPYRFSAVNGWQLTLQDLNNLGVKYNKSMRQNLWGTSYLIEDNGLPHHELMQVEGRNYFCHCMARGPIGIVLSHLSILHDAYNANYERIWVMEDDIDIIQNPHLISDMIAKLDAVAGKDGWDFFFTDRDTKNNDGNYVPCYGYANRPDYTPARTERFAQRTQINNDFIKIGARYGAYSMIVNRCGMKKILDFYKEHNIFLPYDMEFYLQDSINMYTVVNDIVSTKPGSLSDNGAPNYLSKNYCNQIRNLVKKN